MLSTSWNLVPALECWMLSSKSSSEFALANIGKCVICAEHVQTCKHYYAYMQCIVLNQWALIFGDPCTHRTTPSLQTTWTFQDEKDYTGYHCTTWSQSHGYQWQAWEKLHTDQLCRIIQPNLRHHQTSFHPILLGTVQIVAISPYMSPDEDLRHLGSSVAHWLIEKIWNSLSWKLLAAKHILLMSEKQQDTWNSQDLIATCKLEIAEKEAM
jgi:hypothetical protein